MARGTQPGFTLLEVLVALVIVALGLMAAFGQVNQTLTAANRLREKTIAHWVAVDQVTKLRLAGEFPAIGSRTDEVEMARTRWLFTTKVTKTDLDPDLREVDISVAYVDKPKLPIETVSGFISKPPSAAPATGTTPPAADWTVVPPAT